MKNYLMGRISPVLLAALVFGGYTYRDEMTWNLRGKGQFMVHEMSRFDKYFSSPTVGHSIGMAAAMVVALGVYEVVAAVIVKNTTSRS
jgi:hypothetical protein